MQTGKLDALVACVQVKTQIVAKMLKLVMLIQMEEPLVILISVLPLPAKLYQIVKEMQTAKPHVFWEIVLTQRQLIIAQRDNQDATVVLKALRYYVRRQLFASIQPALLALHIVNMEKKIVYVALTMFSVLRTYVLQITFSQANVSRNAKKMDLIVFVELQKQDAITYPNA